MTISNEAVEAGAKATFEHTNEGCPWESVGTYWADVYRDAARAALEAAATIIQAEALEEAAVEIDSLEYIGDLPEEACSDESNAAYAAYANSTDMAEWLKARAAAMRGEG